MRERIAKEVLEDTMDNHPAKRICKLKSCSKRFVPSRRWQMYCCPEHHDLYWKDLRTKAGNLDKCADIGTNKDLIESLRQARQK